MKENKIYLSKEKLENIATFLLDFEADYFCISSVSESGIGAITKVTIDTEVNGHVVTVTKIISDVNEW